MAVTPRRVFRIDVRKASLREMAFDPETRTCEGVSRDVGGRRNGNQDYIVVYIGVC